MRAALEGQFLPAGGISFDAAHTMHGAYAEATPEQKHTAALHAVTQARDMGERHTFLNMLGLTPPRPQEGTPCGSGR